MQDIQPPVKFPLVILTQFLFSSIQHFLLGDALIKSLQGIKGSKYLRPTGGCHRRVLHPEGIPFLVDRTALS
jgi:hypothetical protein